MVRFVLMSSRFSPAARIIVIGAVAEVSLWNPYALSIRLILNYCDELRIFRRSPAGPKTELNASDGISCPGARESGRAGTPAQHLRDACEMPGFRVRESLMTTLHADFASQDYFRDPAAAIGKLRTLGPVVQVRFP